MKEYNYRQPKQESVKYPVNEGIKADQLFVIDEEGTQLGLMGRTEALELARSKELDLILVAPNAQPPVGKIYSWSKFKYQQEKKRKESKSKSIEMKEMWFKVFIDEGDLNHKLKKVIEFLGDKNPVKILIKSKGRTSKTQVDILMDKITAKLEGFGEKEGDSKFDGRNMTVIFRPSKTVKLQENEKKDTQSNS